MVSSACRWRRTICSSAANFFTSAITFSILFPFCPQDRLLLGRQRQPQAQQRIALAFKVTGRAPGDGVGFEMPERRRPLEGPRVVFMRPFTGASASNFSRSAERFLMTLYQQTDDLLARTKLIIVHNWFEELKQRVPVQ